MVEFYPVIKVNQPSIIGVWRDLPLNCIFIRLQDLINQRTMRLNNVFYAIKEKGGIHEYLGFYGSIVLSAIMKDKIIRNFTAEQYAEAINTIRPDYYTTPDGETYEGELILSEQEIKRCIIETMKLLRLCPDSKPLGQIKGCTQTQILTHIRWLKLLGISNFIFHIGDFFRNGKEAEMNKAKEYALLIRNHANKLILYGVSSQKKMSDYVFADAYASLGYFVIASHGQRCGENRIQSATEPYTLQLVRHNLKQMIINTQNLEHRLKQKKLFEGGICPWAEESEAKELATLEIRVPVHQVP